MTKKIITFSILLALLAGCTNKKSITIEGKLNTGEKHERVYLSRIDVDINTRIDSAKVKNNGNFKFRIEAEGPDFYQVGFSGSDFITVLAEPGEKIKLTFNGDNLYENYNVEGSAGSSKIKMLDMVLAETIRKIDSLKAIYTTEEKSPDFNEKETLLNEEYLRLVKEQRQKNIEFIIENLNSFASIKALYQKIEPDLYVLYETRDLQFFKLVSDTLIYHYPNSNQAKALKKNFDKEYDQLKINMLKEAVQNAPEVKLDANLKDLNGNRIALSSLKGKVVLLTFWSSRIRECIAENLTLKDLYKTYKPFGFEIYQVNLDENEADWRNGVKFDELPWISVREDDPRDPVTARLFNIKSLPANYIYDKTGTIVASNLHGKSLQIKLGQLFGK